VRALVVEDDKDLNRQLVGALADAGFAVDAAADGEEGYFLGDTEPYDVVILDMGMPLLNGLDTARQIRRLNPHIKLIMLTVDDDPDLAAEALRAGISGYLLKTSVGTELTDAIAATLKGDRYVTKQMLSRMEELFVRWGTRSILKRSLTARQREVLQLLAEGRTMKEAA